MLVKEVMTSGVECVGPDTSLEDAARRMKELNIGPLPVCDNDRLTGMVTDRDITVRATAKGRNPAETKVRDVMTPDVVFCYEDDNIRQAVRLMEQNQIRRLLVLNRDKRLVGIVSLGDLAVKTGNEPLAGEALERVSEPAAPVR